MNGVSFLNSGLRIPSIGLGTFQLKVSSGHEDLIYDTLDKAFSCGYRLIDTASVYKNEEDIGKALKKLYIKHGLTRQDIFITSKLGPKQHGYPNASEALFHSVKSLDCEYLDLYLIHWPGVQGLTREDPKNEQARTASWEALREVKSSNVVRSIGVSNYTIRHLEEMARIPTDLPSVLQVEFHPKLFQKELLDFCQKHKIYMQAYTSLGQGKLLAEDTVIDIAKKHNKSPAQILLKWALQHGVGVIPKSTSFDHMKENIELFDFSLTSEDMDALNAMNTGEHYCWDPTLVA